MISHSRLIGASLVSFSKSTFRSKAIQLLLLYKKYVVTVTAFCNWLQEFIFGNHADIILGDFNINGFDEGRLYDVLANYNQILKYSYIDLNIRSCLFA